MAISLQLEAGGKESPGPVKTYVKDRGIRGTIDTEIREPATASSDQTRATHPVHAET